MSFSTSVKNEIIEVDYTKLEDISFLSGYIRNNYLYDGKNLIITSENRKIIDKIYSLIKKYFDINMDIVESENSNFSKNKLINIIISDKIIDILNNLMVFDNDKYINHVKDYIVDSDDLKKAYLRGVFLATGSVNDPKTSRYHMEFLVNDNNEALSIVDLLSYFHINAKIINREKGYMVYVKDSENISDFLKLIGANRAVMYYEDIRAFRDKKNMANRLNNCEQANVDKVISAAKSQLEDCVFLLDVLGEKLINERLLVAIIYRMKYPESSLEELSNIISLETGKKITKSGLNHRFRDIKNKVIALKENNN